MIAVSAIIPIAPPDVAIALTHEGGDHFKKDQKITYQLQVQDVVVTGPVTLADSIKVTFVVPVGLRQIMVSGQSWDMSLSATMSPAVLTATYIGPYPALPGQLLPPIFVTGQLTEDAIPSLTTTATVGTPGDSNPANNIAFDTVFVKQTQQECEQQNDDNCNKKDHGQSHQKNQKQSSHNNNNQGSSKSNDKRSTYPTLPDTGGSPE